MTVPWSTFLTFPDGQPKFSDAWLLHAPNVTSSFPSEPHYYCRLCDSYFGGGAQEHVAGHAASLADWRESQKGKTVEHIIAERRQRKNDAVARARGLSDEGTLPAEIAEIMGVSKRTVLRYLEESTISKNCDFPRSHAGSNGHDAEAPANPDVLLESDKSAAIGPYPLSEEDRRKAHSQAARKRRMQTFKTKTEARRAEAWKLYERGLVSKAIAEQLGISDRTLRRYLAENGALTSGDQLRRLM
jgi:predicted transcriptional regulator